MVRNASLLVHKLMNHWKSVLATTMAARDMIIFLSLSKSTFPLPTQQSTASPINTGTARGTKSCAPYSIIGGVAVCILFGWGFHIIRNIHHPLPPDSIVKSSSDIVVDVLDYPSAMKAIKVDHDISKMLQLSESGNADATYLLSRLYFQSKTPNNVSNFIFDVQRVEYQADSISNLKSLLKIEPEDSVFAILSIDSFGIRSFSSTILR